MTKPDTLTSQQRRALPYLVGGPSVEAGCRQAKISRETFYRWLRESPPFVQALNEQRDAMLADALKCLKGATARAVSVLVRLLDSKQETVRERTAGRILDHVLKIKGIEELSKRVEVLEERLSDSKH